MKKGPVFFSILFCTLSCVAWDGGGHMTCGAIAYYYLKAHDHKALAKTLKTLKLHPWYNNRWKEKTNGLTGEKKKIALFMLASTFPDDARPFPELGGGIKTKWHYVDYPFAVGGNISGTGPDSINAERRINELLATLPVEKEDSQKALDICWLFHLVEDVHQPLHAASLFDADHPTGDRGGNDTYIIADTFGNLHYYWDHLVRASIQTAPDVAQQLLHDQASLSEAESADTSVHDWIKKESYELAVHQVYQEGRINGTKAKPTKVSADYIRAASDTGRRRVYLGSIRLAQKIEGICK
jgi:hypothetical protein